MFELFLAFCHFGDGVCCMWRVLTFFDVHWLKKFIGGGVVIFWRNVGGGGYWTYLAFNTLKFLLLCGLVE